MFAPESHDLFKDLDPALWQYHDAVENIVAGDNGVCGQGSL
jgi:hypothetical protein